MAFMINGNYSLDNTVITMSGQPISIDSFVIIKLGQKLKKSFIDIAYLVPTSRAKGTKPTKAGSKWH